MTVLSHGQGVAFGDVGLPNAHGNGFGIDVDAGACLVLNFIIIGGISIQIRRQCADHSKGNMFADVMIADIVKTRIGVNPVIFNPYFFGH